MRCLTSLAFAVALSAPARPADPPKIDWKAGVQFTGRADGTAVEIRPRLPGVVTRVSVEEGEKVKKGDLLAELDDRAYKLELATAKARLAQSQAQLKIAGAELARVKRLFETGAATKEDYNKAEFGKEEAEAMVAVGKAGVEVAQLNLEFTKLTAPIDGRVARVQKVAGSLVRADEAVLMTVIAADPVAVVFDVDERTLLAIERAMLDGSKPMVEVGLADEENFPHKAAQVKTGLTVDPKTGAAQFRATLANPKELIKPGMFLRVKLTMQPGK